MTQTGLVAEDADQHEFGYRFGWGIAGLRALAPASDVVVVVDVLRFTSAVSVATSRGAVVYPYRWRDDTAAAFAAARGAVLAGAREHGPVSLSPTDLMTLPPGSRIVLPSPNGSTLSAEAVELGTPFVLAGCLRNATATARRAMVLANGGPIAVVAAGEHWPADAGLRPCVEDLLGAGAVLAALDPSAAVAAPRCSPEAAAARSAFVAARPSLSETLAASGSGRELARRGWADDVDTAAALDADGAASQLVDDAYAAV
ncbi:MAG: 2-phosphosulfolactate phosphatase [Ilumatobacter sp.]|uniref:2-phosphosulfolactate phosphatase n=1 Tax=Ilumatobacter sp. TaxID=1967498 RepID=UPI002634DDAC|nr:2-phosphosulfolactate phosphatase [Ilumatobacter sp.]MDJ0768063.1 2-phosphosulfolactate phosphatase [Ilumatobacter sp.]